MWVNPLDKMRRDLLMANDEIYGWYQEFGKSYNTAMVEDEFLHGSIFRCAEPIDYCMTQGWYRNFYTIKIVNETQGPPSNFFRLIVKNTEKWYKDRYPIPCNTSFSKDIVLEYDFLRTILDVPTVSSWLYELMREVCTEEFEAFDISIKTGDGHVLDGYKLINITKYVYDALDIDCSKFTGGRRYRDPETKKIKKIYIGNEALKEFYQDPEAGMKKYGDIEKFFLSFSYLRLTGLRWMRYGDNPFAK